MNNRINTNGGFPLLVQCLYTQLVFFSISSQQATLVGFGNNWRYIILQSENVLQEKL